jgi:hypothetical protein
LEEYMSVSPSGQKPGAAPDGIDFELTDFGDARKAMDDLPPGVVEVQRMLSTPATRTAAQRAEADLALARARALLEAAGYRVIPPLP